MPIRRTGAGRQFGAGRLVGDALADVDSPLFHREIAPNTCAQVVGSGSPERPDAHGPVVASRGEAVAIGSKGYRVDKALMTGEDLRCRLELALIPEADGLVLAGLGEVLAVGGKCY